MPDTVWDLLRTGVGGNPALLAEDGSVLSHDDVRATLVRLRDWMRALGVGVEDRIAIVLPNGPGAAVAFLAAAVTGCAAPLNPRYRSDELRFYLEDLGARVLITGDSGGEAARDAAGDEVLRLRMQGSLDALELLPDDRHSGEEPAPDSIRGRNPVASSSHAAGASGGTAVPGPDDVALVLHTSGTTSRPKIVPLRQRNLGCSAAEIADFLRLTAADRSLNVMPLFHIHGLLAGLLAPLSAGGSVVATEGFDAFRFFGQLRDLRPTYYTAVPTMHQMVLARSARYAREARSARLRFVRSSSASLPGPVLEELRDLFGVPVVESYGMTEATHQMCANPLPPGEAKTRSVGLPAGIELAILDEAGRTQPPGTRGEVSIKGPTVIDGYENNPTADEAAFTDGWFRTGDEGYLDGDGYLFLTGRLKEQINRGGEKISPLEVDEVLLRHEAVAEAVTFAMPHDKLGEEVAAAVVLADDATATETELRHHVGRSLAAFKVPRRMVFCDELPKGPTGKLQRIGLAQRLGLAQQVAE
ncbi:MAG: AMP-binding protein [bacterium]|nr:AMP-binding protein [bacterium]